MTRRSKVISALAICSSPFVVACGSGRSSDVETPGLKDAALPPAVVTQLQAVANATTKYRDVRTALRSGYVRVEDCVPRAGSHYVKKSLVDDPSIEPLKPDILMYAPAKAGLKLAAVEYIVFATGERRPSLFGRSMDGPFQVVGIPELPKPFYWRHVWLWQPNPAGLFALWNPTVSC